MSEYIMEFPAFDSDGWESDKDKWHTQAELKEQIVRCRDCKHCCYNEQIKRVVCMLNCCSHVIVDPDGFCAWGERRHDA